MPQPAQQESEDQIQVSAQATLPVSAQRLEEVIAQPARQRHMPSRPQIRHADCTEWIIEIERKPEPEHQRDADGTKRIAPEVAIGLKGKRRGA
jgi:hypothetical protein